MYVKFAENNVFLFALGGVKMITIVHGGGCMSKWLPYYIVYIAFDDVWKILNNTHVNCPSLKSKGGDTPNT